jgi:preprotein translocase subunit SecE
MEQLKPKGKREAFTYMIMVLWIIMGILGVFQGISLNGLAVYFLSLTGFAGSYLFGESYRKSEGTGIFSKGRSSRRELMIYVSVFLWFLLGIVSIFKNLDFIEVASYFAALTPFVGGAILGETFRKDLMSEYKELGITYSTDIIDNDIIIESEEGTGIAEEDDDDLIETSDDEIIIT